MRTLAVFAACFVASATGWVNTKVQRKIDASNMIVRTTTVVTAENDASAAVDSYDWLIPKTNISSIAKLKATFKGADDTQFIDTTVTKSGEEGDNVVYKVALSKKVAAGEKVLLKVRCSTVGVLRPLPGTVKQGENQKVDYNDNAYYLSKYQTKTQSTTVQLASPTVESYSSESGSVTKASDTLTFGDYTNVAPLSQKPLRFHAVNNKPFCAARTLKRVLEVSMWGNLAVEEWYQIEHVGARLKGSFSRLDYGQSARAAPSSFTTLTARLPAQAQDIYFRDDIGNISTSKVSNPSKGTREVAFTQRFPMFGGWKTRFYYGYNLPLGEVMTTAGGLNRLRVPLASPVRDIWVQDMTVEVILPEGVPTPEVYIAGEKTEDFAVEKRSTYLDYSGRTVVVLKASQLALPERNEELEVVFRFSSSLLGDLVWEPLYLITGFLAIFGSVIFASRVLA